jgi:alpha-L-fucosidase 2
MMRDEGILVYDRPATEWLEALPLGNGRLGAMVFGGTESQRFQVNDSTAWSGSPQSELVDPLDPDRSARVLAELRTQLAAGDYPAARQTALGLQHRHSQAYLPFGDLRLTVSAHGQPEAYVRQLELATGLVRERYTVAGGAVEWTSFVDHDAGVLVVQLVTTVPHGLDVTASLSSPLRVLGQEAAADAASLRLQLPSDVFPSHDLGEVHYSDDPSHSLQGALALRWTSDGTAEPAPPAEDPAEQDLAEQDLAEHEPAEPVLRSRSVHRLTVYVGTQTTLARFGANPDGDSHSTLVEVTRRLDAAATQDPAVLLERHTASHSALFRRVRLRLGGPGVGEAQAPDQASVTTGTTPSHVRLTRAAAAPGGAVAADPGLAALLFNFGRYLLICSSRPGSPPANLQGIWNEELPAPWSSNYTVNINLQMNYWAAEVVGLQECLEPLFGLVEIMQRTGARTARELYDADGWAAHHNADVWGYSQPVGHGRARPQWSLWPMAGFWLVQHLWDHLQFSPPGSEARRRFLEERAWPAIRGATQFGLDWVMELPDGTLATSPSTSPENAFLVDGVMADVGISSTMDLTLLRQTFGYLVALAEELGRTDDEVATAAAAALPRLPGPSAGRGGQVREWLADHPQFEPTHRHLSHLYFVYPGSAEVSPELATAASLSLDGRGDESTGWSLAWKLALRARLGQAAKVEDLMRLVFRDMTTPRGGQSGGLYPNFFAAHPPYQIDGNFGFVAGLAEALLQSHRGEVHLLPALPDSLPEGEVSGLRARGGLTVSMAWRDGRLDLAELTSDTDQVVRVRYGDHRQDLPLRAGRPESVPGL